MMRLLLFTFFALLLAMPGRVGAFCDDCSANVEDHNPKLIKTGEEAIVGIVVRNTGTAAWFALEIVEVPSGWNSRVVTTGELFISGDSTRTYQIGLTPDSSQGNFNFKVRVMGTDVPGEARISLGEFTRSIQVLAPPGPFNIISPEPNQEIEGQHFLTWTNSSNANSYDVTIAKVVNGQPDYSNPIVFQNHQFVNLLLDTAPLEKGAMYEYRVLAKNQVGTTLNQDGPRAFRIKAAPPLGDFSLVAPTLNQTVTPQPVFVWEASQNAQYYELYVLPEEEGVPGPDPIVPPIRVEGNVYEWGFGPLPPSRHYYASVRAFGEGGSRLNREGLVRFFVTGLGQFNLVLPAADEQSVVFQPEFRWGIADGAQSYTFNLFVIPEGEQARLIHTDTIPQSDGFISYFLPSRLILTRNTTYAWNVFANRAQETRENNGGIRLFSTIRMVPFDLISPASGEEGVSQTPTFSWEPTSGAQSYFVELTEPDANGKPNPARSRFGPATTATAWTSTFGPLEKGGEYFWRVTASDGKATIFNYGSYQPFTVNPLSPFSLVSPADGATNTQTQPILSWQQAEGAESYRVHLSIPGAYDLPVIQVPGSRSSVDLVDTGLPLNSLLTYEWTVEAVAGSVLQPATETRTFTTRERTAITPCDVLDAILARQFFTEEDGNLAGVIATDAVDASFYMRSAIFDGPCER